MSAMNVEEQAGVAMAVKKLVERRLTKFKKISRKSKIRGGTRKRPP